MPANKAENLYFYGNTCTLRIPGKWLPNPAKYIFYFLEIGNLNTSLCISQCGFLIRYKLVLIWNSWEISIDVLPFLCLDFWDPATGCLRPVGKAPQWILQVGIIGGDGNERESLVVMEAPFPSFQMP